MAIRWKQNYARYKDFFLNTYSVYKRRESVQTFLELILTLCAISVLALFALRPTILTIIDLLKQIEKKEELIAQMDTKIQNLSVAQTVYSQQAANIELLSSAIPNSADPHKLVEQIMALFAQNGLAVLSLNLNETLVKGISIQTVSNEFEPLLENANFVPFSVTTKGDYNTIKAAISNLENTRRPSIIGNLAIKANTSEEDSSLILTVEGQSVYLLDSQPEE